jgi:hypothetical protein
VQFHTKNANFERIYTPIPKQSNTASYVPVVYRDWFQSTGIVILVWQIQLCSGISSYFRMMSPKVRVLRFPEVMAVGYACLVNRSWKATGFSTWPVIYCMNILFKFRESVQSLNICPLSTNFLRSVVDARYANFGVPRYKEEYPTTWNWSGTDANKVPDGLFPVS